MYIAKFYIKFISFIINFSDMNERQKNQLAEKMAGEIALSSEPGKTMRKWREIFEVSQTELSKSLEVSSSVISDYEGGRRKSPGSNMIKKYVRSLIDIDINRGGDVTRAFSHMTQNFPTDVILGMKEFPNPITAKELSEELDGKIVACEGQFDKKVYGYTVVDSIKAILELTADEFLRLYGLTTERALVFTKVNTGRSPMVAIRVKEMKPAMIVLHSPNKMDKVGKKIANKEKIPTVISQVEESELLERLSNLSDK